MTNIASVQVVLTRIIDQAYPVFGEFLLTSTTGVAVFREKLPVLGVDLGPDTEAELPMTVYMDCTIVSSTSEGTLIDTSLPNQIEDIHGHTRFIVEPNTLSKNSE